jgi:hypothetical protein
MAAIPLKPTMLVARATQMAADSIGAIDQQFLAARAIYVDPQVLPSLSNDLAVLHRTLQQWPERLRPFAGEVLSRTWNEDANVLQEWSEFDKQNQGMLLIIARWLQYTVDNSSREFERLQAALAPFRTAIDQAVSTLRGDLQAVTSSLVSEEILAVILAQEAQQQQDKIHSIEHNPWRLMVDGMSIVGLIRDLQTIQNAENQARVALSRLQQLQPQIQQLAAARGPLLGLSLSVAGLAGGVSNMQTAMTQVANQLNGILQQPPLPAIMAAMLGAAVEDLSAADGIIREMLSGARG